MLKNLIYSGLALIIFSSCDNKDITDTQEPSNLLVNLIYGEEGSGIVNIQSSAENTVEFMLIIDDDSESAESNTTGTFEHTFEIEGYHTIEVRAFGVNGKYIKKDFQIEITLGAVNPDDGYVTPLTYAGYDLIWNDEFEGSSVNTNDWNFEIGTGSGGWGNNELQYYREENAWLEDGLLIIEADNIPYLGSDYTSARITTQGKQSFTYGRIDIRALLPEGQGLWPALWMLGQNFSSVGWPACGEIDIMEMIGGSDREDTVHGTLHWDENGHASAGNSYQTSGETFAEIYHVFTILWDETSIKWLVDDVQYGEINITPSFMTEFHDPQFFIFNLAVGGNWPGSPDATTIFPQKMKVDYVRVFQTNKK